MELSFMQNYPNLYITVVNEIENYSGASLLTDQITKRVIYRAKKLSDKEKQLTPYTIKILTRKAAHELLNRKKQIDDTAGEDLLHMHDNGLIIDKQLIEDEFLHAVILLAQDSSEEIILSEWAKGCSDTEIAYSLSSISGGSIESSRSKIRRYRHKIRKSEKLLQLLSD